VVLLVLYIILAIVVYVASRIIFFVGRYYYLKGPFKDFPRLEDPSMPKNFAFLTLFVPNFNIRLAESFNKTYSEEGIPPVLYAGPFLDGHPTVFINGPAAIRSISDDELFPKHPISYDIVACLLGDGLVTSKGELWRQQRNLIHPWFHPNKLRQMFDVMRDNGEELIGTLRSSGAKEVDVGDVMGQTTQKVLIEAMFSGKLDSHWVHKTWTKANRALLLFAFGMFVLGKTLNSLWIWPGTRSIASTRAAFHVKILQLIKEAEEKKGKEGAEALENGDFIEYLVAHNCSPDLIFEESLTMLFAGHDTTKNTLSWLMYFCGSHPEIFQEIQKEVDTELKGALPTFNDLGKLRICKNAVMETLRLRPPVPGMQRIVTQDTTIGGFCIPKGTTLNMHFFGSLIDPKIWKNPLEFNPSRFDEEGQYSYQFIPFSVGPRNCIGQKFALNEGILFCAMIAQNFDVKLCLKYI